MQAFGNLVRFPTVEDELTSNPVCFNHPKRGARRWAESQSDLRFMTCGLSQGSWFQQSSLEAEHGTGIQDNGILFLSLSMERKRHFTFLSPFLWLLSTPSALIKMLCGLTNWHPDPEQDEVGLHALCYQNDICLGGHFTHWVRDIILAMLHNYSHFTSSLPSCCVGQSRPDSGGAGAAGIKAHSTIWSLLFKTKDPITYRISH